MENVDFKKLKKDLLKRFGPSSIMPLISLIDKADEDELLELAEKYKIDIEKYIKEDF